MSESLLTVRESSPALAGHIARHFSASDWGQIAQSYLQALAAGAAAELLPGRTPGSSFNPAPARIAEIIIKETAMIDRDLTCAAFWIGARTPPPDQKVASMVTRARSLGAELSEPEPIQILAAAFYLDCARHAHLMSDCQSTASALFGRINTLIPALTSPSCARLVTLLKTSASRLHVHVCNAA